MSEYPIAHTVADLIAELQKLDPNAVVHCSEPPFVGLQVIPQVPSGNIYIAPMPRPVVPSTLNFTQGAGGVWRDPTGIH